MTNEQSLYEATQIGYKIEFAYSRADMFRPESDEWHAWMDEAKRLETLLRENY